MHHDLPSAVEVVKAHVAAEPLVIDGTYVPPPQHQVEVLCEENLTPVNGENVRWINDGRNTDPDASGQPHWVRNNDCFAYAAACGMKRYQMAGPAQLNRHVWWTDCKDLADFAVNGMKIPDNVVMFDPPTEAACRAIGSLSGNPQRFGGTAETHCPIMIDIEGGKWITSPSDTAAERKDKLGKALDSYRWLRAGSGSNVPLYVYGGAQFRDVPYVGGPDAETDALMDEWRAATTPCAYFYFGEEILTSATRYRDECDRMLNDLATRYPGREHVVILSPTIMILNPAAHPDIAYLNGGPVPFDQFAYVVRRCAEAGCVLAMWTGYSLLDGKRPHIAFLASHGLTPTGDAAHYH
jgi:hypothetical protein